MAMLIPSLAETSQLVEPLNDGERRVAERLDKLGDGWTVFIQPRLTMDLPDFVAVHPEYGVCAIEVKDWKPGRYRNVGGTVQVRAADGWSEIDEHPLMQPYRYQSTILEQHFAFPDDGAAIAPCVRSMVILLNHPTRRAREILRAPATARWGKVAIHGDDVLTHLERTLIGPTPCAPPGRSLERLCRSLRDGSPVFRMASHIALSDSAKDIATNPRNARTRRVRGAAGAGKSVGVAHRAARLAAEGKSVLVVCFTSTLPHYLRSLVSAAGGGGSAASVECTHFHGFCRAIIDSAEARQLTLQPWPNVRPDERVVLQATEATELGVRRAYDAILVDEGQDFRLEWWNLLREHLTPGGEMLLVADDTQRIFDVPRWTDAEMLGAGFSGPWTTLRDSYRIPPGLVPVYREFANRYLDGDNWLPDGASAVDSTHRRWINVDSTTELGTQVAQATSDLLADPALVEVDSDVTFLLPTHDQGLIAARALEQRGRTVHHIFAQSAERTRAKHRFVPTAPGVKGCTVHSFKGWESRVLVVGIGTGDHAARLAYVVMTRLKHSTERPAAIVVVNANPALRGFADVFEHGVPLAPPSLPQERPVAMAEAVS
jgi:hypothetical protein